MSLLRPRRSAAQQLFGQLLIGLINGSFYALLSLGLAVIFGMLNIVNFAHGAFYMMGAFVAYFLLDALRPQLLVGARPVAARSSARSAPWSSGCSSSGSPASIRSTACCSPSAWRSVFQGLFQNYFGASGHALCHPEAAQRRL